MDKLVLDIETKNTFAEVGGQENIHKLEVSFVGVYSYNQNQYFSFFENELDKLGPMLQSAGLIIGFCSNRFDLPVLKKHYKFNIMSLESLDILEEIEERLGHRISLNELAYANLRTQKTAHGLEAIKFYKEGRLEELKKYCLNDVKITKDLYDLGMSQGHLVVPQRTTGEMQKVEFDWHTRLPSASTLF
ncbi:MAG: ribonuclease H-like domain-containing protein [bacterium]|nr:ribonuclease H-like domain-containing protein [bacterium]